MARTDLTAQRLRELLHYDPETGVFTWLARAAHRNQIGDVAGHVHNLWGYRIIGISNVQHRANRLAWLYVTGDWPQGDIDHKDGRRDNDRIANLRDVSDTVNMQNRAGPQRNNTSGYLGVAWDKSRGKWVAGIYLNGKRVNLGRFDDKDAAHAAYMQARRMHYEGNLL